VHIRPHSQPLWALIPLINPLGKKGPKGKQYWNQYHFLKSLSMIPERPKPRSYLRKQASANAGVGGQSQLRNPDGREVRSEFWSKWSGGRDSREHNENWAGLTRSRTYPGSNTKAKSRSESTATGALPGRPALFASSVSARVRSPALGSQRTWSC
jgi:hypothetical protein